jgi:hypothetical protein
VGHDKIKLFESYSCARDCKTGSTWDRETRAGRGCTRPDLPAVRWDLDARRLFAPRRLHDASLYLGRYPDPALEGTVDLRPVHHELPHERTEDGCPGGWYRTAYATSVLFYARPRTDTGARVDHGLLVDADPQIWAAVRELEREERRAQAHVTERAQAIAERKRKGGRKRGR